MNTIHTITRVVRDTLCVHAKSLRALMIDHEKTDLEQSKKEELLSSSFFTTRSFLKSDTAVSSQYETLARIHRTRNGITEAVLPNAAAIETNSPVVLPEAPPNEASVPEENEVDELDVNDSKKRHFLKILGGGALGILATSLLPEKASALVVGSTPTSNVVGVRDANNTRISPATSTGNGVTKLTTSLASSGTVRTPASGKSIRVYATRFSLTADATSVSFRFTAGGTDYEKYLSPKTGGLYGSNNHPNYVQGGVDEVLYCAIAGTTTVQINVDYLEV